MNLRHIKTFILPQLQGDLRTMALDTLLRRASKLPDLFRQLRSKKFVSLLDVRWDRSSRGKIFSLCSKVSGLEIDRYNFFETDTDI